MRALRAVLAVLVLLVYGQTFAGDTKLIVLPSTTSAPGNTEVVYAGGGLVVGKTLGPELVIDGGMSDTANWTEGTGWSLATGAAVHTGGTVGTLTPAVSLAPTPGDTYEVTITGTFPDTRSLLVALGGTTMTSGLATTGTHVFTGTAGTTGNLTFTPTTAGTTITIDDVHVRKVTSEVSSASGGLLFKENLLSEYAHEAAFRFNYTVDKTAVKDDTGIEINMIDIASGGTSTPFKVLQNGASTPLFAVYGAGGIVALSYVQGATISANSTTSATSIPFSHTGTQSTWGSIYKDSGTVGVMNGSDVLNIFDAAITNSTHTGTLNELRAFNAGNIAVMPAGTGVAYGVKIGTGYTYPIIAAPPTAQTIAAGNTVAADACGTMKQITAAGAVTTNTTNTFTAADAYNSGCCMDVVNVGAQNITLDTNALFFSPAASDVVMTANDSIRVCSNGSAWYAVGPLVAN